MLDRLSAALLPATGHRHPRPADVEAGFDALADLYYAYWGDYFHPALFPPGEYAEDVDAAYERTHERYFDQIGAERAASIADLACGGGALTVWMAARTAGEVVGIDRSRRQLEIAERRRAASQRANVRFVRHDLLELGGLQERFEAAICLDAACYLPDRTRFLDQVARCLTPGARLLVADWCRIPDPTRLQRELILDPLYAGWAIADLETVDGYRQAFTAAGLELLSVDDLSEAVAPNWERGYRAALAAVGEPMRVDRALSMGVLATRHGPRVIAAAKAQFGVALLVKAAADAGVLRYVVFVAERQPKRR